MSKRRVRLTEAAEKPKKRERVRISNELSETEKKASLKRWKDKVPPPNAKPKECKYCHHIYIYPCDSDSHKECDNWLWLQSKGKTSKRDKLEPKDR